LQVAFPFDFELRASDVVGATAEERLTVLENFRVQDLIVSARLDKGEQIAATIRFFYDKMKK
jgi:hypothetical protein